MWKGKSLYFEPWKQFKWIKLIIYCTTECCERVKVSLCYRWAGKQQTLLDVSAVTVIKVKPPKWHWENIMWSVVLEFLKTMKLNDLLLCRLFPKSNFPERSMSRSRWVMKAKLCGPQNKQRLMCKHSAWSMPRQKQPEWQTWGAEVVSVMTLHLPSLRVCNEVTSFRLWRAAMKLSRLRRQKDGLS